MIALCAERGRKNKPSINSVNSILPLRKKMYFVSDIINTVSRFYPIIEKEDFVFLFSLLKKGNSTEFCKDKREFRRDFLRNLAVIFAIR